MLDKAKLCGRIRAYGLTMEQTAKYLGVNSATLSRKINGISEFNRNEIELLRVKLSLSADELQEIFFSR